MIKPTPHIRNTCLHCAATCYQSAIQTYAIWRISQLRCIYIRCNPLQSLDQYYRYYCMETYSVTQKPRIISLTLPYFTFEGFYYRQNIRKPQNVPWKFNPELRTDKLVSRNRDRTFEPSAFCAAKLYLGCQLSAT